MPEIVRRRAGSLFYHRDTRLKETGHPVVVKSVDLGDLSPRFKRHQIVLDYGFGGDGRIYCEVQVYKPRPQMHWAHHCIDVAALIEPGRRRPESLRLLARTLGVSQTRLMTAIVTHAPWRDDTTSTVWN